MNAERASLWLQVSRTLEEEIRRNHQAGDCLPPEPVLAERFGIHRHTLRRAVGRLVEVGILERRQGAGTFVLTERIDYPIAGRTRFTENMNTAGLAVDCKVLARARVALDARDARHLGLAAGTPVLSLRLLRSAGAIPTVLGRVVLAGRAAEALGEWSGGSLYQALEQATGLSPRRRWTRVRAELPSQEEARLLRLPTSAPILRTLGLDVDPEGRPVALARAEFRGDRVDLVIGDSP